MARLVAPIGLDAAKNFDKAENLNACSRMTWTLARERIGHQRGSGMRGLWLVFVALGIVSSVAAAQDRRGIRFWNLTLYTITKLQMSPAGKELNALIG